jgi:putative membrane protein
LKHGLNIDDKTSIKGIFEMKKNFVVKAILWVVQGFIVGLGAILPGVSGGTLCYAFGIYDQIIEVLSNPFKGAKKHWKMLIFIGIGGVLGFVGFAGITERLLKWNEAVVLCVFVGLIAGTVPELWREAGKEKRSKFSILSLVISFAAISVVFYLFKSVLQLTLAPNLGGWLVCGLLWGLSFIIPGFSSSTLLLFFGIYEQMSHGISHLDFGVLLPLGIAMLATLLLFSKIMKLLFDKYHSIASHAVMGFVLATTLMILPSFNTGVGNIAVYVICIVCGAVASFGFNALCNKIKSGADED